MGKIGSKMFASQCFQTYEKCFALISSLVVKYCGLENFNLHFTQNFSLISEIFYQINFIAHNVILLLLCCGEVILKIWRDKIT